VNERLTQVNVVAFLFEFMKSFQLYVISKQDYIFFILILEFGY